MSLIKGAVAAFGLFMLIGGWAYGHSSGFKAECLAHKVASYDMGTLKNLICDAEFDIKSE